MKNGFSLLEMMVVVVIVAVLTAIAVPQYRGAVESARMTEVVVLWGKYKNFISGRDIPPEEIPRMQDRLSKARLKYFTADIFCQENAPTESCWEIQFTPKNTSVLHYKIITRNHFSQLACVGLNGAGENFCDAQSNQDPITLNGEKVYPIR